MMPIFDGLELVSSNLYHLPRVDTWDPSIKNKDLSYCLWKVIWKKKLSLTELV